LMLEEISRHSAEGRSFAFETTLSGLTYWRKEKTHECFNKPYAITFPAGRYRHASRPCCAGSSGAACARIGGAHAYTLGCH
jgi:hypothetical protein